MIFSRGDLWETCRCRESYKCAPETRAITGIEIPNEGLRHSEEEDSSVQRIVLP
jgi:hypothetical protein